MELYIVRHGQTEYNVRNVYQGHEDIPLNKTGIMQAKETGKKFENIKIDAILVSPLIRARQTAKYICDATGIPLTIKEGLIERSFGDMEGKPNREDCNIKMLLDYDKNYDIYHVEPIQALFARVHDFLDTTIEEYKGKSIVLVTHGGVAQAIECYFHGMPENKDIQSLSLKNGEIRKYNVPEKIKEEFER